MYLAIVSDAIDAPGKVEDILASAGHRFEWFATVPGESAGNIDDRFDLALLVQPSERMGTTVVEAVRHKLPARVPMLVTTPGHFPQVVDFLCHSEPGARDRSPRGALGPRSESYKTVLSCPPYHLDLSRGRLWIDRAARRVTAREFELAAFLFRNHDRVVNRDHILTGVWGYKRPVMTRTVDTHMSRLQAKLELNGEHGWVLRAVYQRGYRLESPVGQGHQCL